MESELKPCPFCGGRAKMYNWGVWGVRCTDCGAGSDWDIEEHKAIEAWNRRVEDGEDNT